MTSVGERIYDLRNRNNMSQGALADKLDVSRQTISKWENNMCMPETDKLIQLSEIFGVSTDYILKGITIVEPEPVYIYVKDPDSENTSKYNEKIVRKYVGIVMAVIVAVLMFIFAFADLIFPIILSPILLLSILLTCNVKHPWLIVSWLTYLGVVTVMQFISLFDPMEIFDYDNYIDPHYFVLLVYGYAAWIILAVLILCTVKAKRGYIFKKKQ